MMVSFRYSSVLLRLRDKRLRWKRFKLSGLVHLACGDKGGNAGNASTTCTTPSKSMLHLRSINSSPSSPGCTCPLESTQSMLGESGHFREHRFSWKSFKRVPE